MSTSKNTLEKARGLSEMGYLLIDKNEQKQYAQTFLEEAINSIYSDKSLCNENLYDNELALTILEMSYIDCKCKFIII